MAKTRKGLNLMKRSLEIRSKCQEIYQRYLELKNKTAVAKEFGISGGGVDSALIYAGHPELSGSWLRKQKLGTPSTPKKGEAPKVAQPEPPVDTVPRSSEIAAQLLTRAVEAINRNNLLAGENRVLHERVEELEARLKKAIEERDRTLKVYNELVKQANSGNLPSVESIVDVLRREHKVGEKM